MSKPNYEYYLNYFKDGQSFEVFKGQFAGMDFDFCFNNNEKKFNLTNNKEDPEEKVAVVGNYEIVNSDPLEYECTMEWSVDPNCDYGWESCGSNEEKIKIKFNGNDSITFAIKGTEVTFNR